MYPKGMDGEAIPDESRDKGGKQTVADTPEKIDKDDKQKQNIGADPGPERYGQDVFQDKSSGNRDGYKQDPSHKSLKPIYLSALGAWFRFDDQDLFDLGKENGRLDQTISRILILIFMDTRYGSDQQPLREGRTQF